eukprot:307123-Amphidinium_carterae.1
MVSSLTTRVLSNTKELPCLFLNVPSESHVAQHDFTRFSNAQSCLGTQAWPRGQSSHKLGQNETDAMGSPKVTSLLAMCAITAIVAVEAERKMSFQVPEPTSPKRRIQEQ